MSKNQIACCPSCGGRIPFKKFLLLNNYSVANCNECHFRIEIENRNENALIAGISGATSSVLIILCTYYGYKDYASIWGGFLSGFCLAIIVLFTICYYTYCNAKLNRIPIK